ncbi:MAG: hypothetical protein IKC48_02585 [Clostridia bacterium]|nr:hypothetical protein [Clostridia bacterium]
MEKNTKKFKIKRVAPKPAEHKVAKLELLVTVVNRVKGEFYADLIQSFDVNMQLFCLGKGTARAEVLRYLGLADTQKAVIFSVIREDKVENALSVLGEKFNTIKNGKGIAFTVPMSSIIGVAIYGFLSDNRDTVKEENNG